MPRFGFRGGRGGGRGGGNVGRPTQNALMRNKILSGTTNSAKRLQKDYKALKDATVPLVGVSAAPTDNSMFIWHANIKGPENTAYEGGCFHMEITFPENYPVSPPSIKLFTKIPHPNVFGTTLCLDMLQPNSGSSSS
jgi:ubiquitin-protein ligase